MGGLFRGKERRAWRVGGRKGGRDSQQWTPVASGRIPQSNDDMDQLRDLPEQSDTGCPPQRSHHLSLSHPSPSW